VGPKVGISLSICMVNFLSNTTMPHSTILYTNIILLSKFKFAQMNIHIPFDWHPKYLRLNALEIWNFIASNDRKMIFKNL
jgi:hypothetical protein